jgi:hypothetical protein
VSVYVCICTALTKSMHMVGLYHTHSYVQMYRYVYTHMCV